MSETKPAAAVSLAAVFQAFFVLGATSFGGGVVAYLRETLVSSLHWLDDEDFLADLELSQTLPGLNATNMSVLVGDRLRGLPGAVVAFLGMTLPGTVVVFVLGVLYGVHGHYPTVNAILAGIAAAAIGLLLAVTLQIGRKQLSDPRDMIILVITFAAVGLFHVALHNVLLTVGPAAIFLHRRSPATEASKT